MIGDVTTDDVEAEARVIELCRPGLSDAVVEVIRHGWLPRQGSMYYIDMEYCPETLESRIHDTRHEGTVQGAIDFLSPPTTSVPAVDDTNSPSSEFDCQPVLDIIHEINCGLMYLHLKSV